MPGPEICLAARECRDREAVAAGGNVVERARRNREITGAAAAIGACQGPLRAFGNVLYIEK